jgi:hypothetical protein
MVLPWNLRSTSKYFYFTLGVLPFGRVQCFLAKSDPKSLLYPTAPLNPIMQPSGVESSLKVPLISWLTSGRNESNISEEAIEWDTFLAQSKPFKRGPFFTIRKQSNWGPVKGSTKLVAAPKSHSTDNDQFL